jgi:uncharacterized protein (TIGR00251 family)
MIISVKVIPGAKKDLFKEAGGSIRIYLTAPPLDGRANDALVDFLADHYHVRRAQIEIIKGLKSRNKVINISTV